MILHINTKEQNRVEVTLKKEGKVIKSLSAKNKFGSQVLLPLISRLNIAHPGGVQGVEVETGPGSFTGLRVGVTTAKVLAYALRWKVLGISGLEAIAYGAAREGLIGVILDARRQKLYRGIYERKKGRFRTVKKPALLAVDKFLEEIDGPVFLVGSGVPLCEDSLLKMKKKEMEFSKDPDFFYPKASLLGELAREKMKEERYDDPFSLDPLYLYPRDCNVVKKRGK